MSGSEVALNPLIVNSNNTVIPLTSENRLSEILIQNASTSECVDPQNPSTLTQKELSQTIIDVRRNNEDMQVHVWEKLSVQTLKSCIEKKPLQAFEKTEFVNLIADYMKNILKDLSSGIAKKIASNVCSKYPKSFEICIAGQKWSDGVNSIHTCINNRIQYMKIRGTKRGSSCNGENNTEVIPKKKKLRLAVSKTNTDALSMLLI